MIFLKLNFYILQYLLSIDFIGTRTDFYMLYHEMLKMANAKRDAIVEIKNNKDLSLKERQAQMKALEKEEQEIYDEYIEMFKNNVK